MTVIGKKSRKTAFALLMFVLSSPAWADVKVHGATTVAFGLMKPHKAEIEKLTGVEITVLPSSTTRGLADLVEGRADIAMLAEPLEVAAVAANTNQPEFINPADYVDRHVGDAFVQFIVHPSNPVQKITRAQLARLYSGEIKNWSEIGGNNQQVMIVGEPTSAPYRMIKESLAISYASDLRIVQNTNQIAIIVVQAPGALGNISTAHDVPERSKFKVVETPLKLPLHLYLAIRKDAPEQVKRVVDAAASLGGL
jgi:phosphate transport system substrate-binding protein